MTRVDAHGRNLECPIRDCGFVGETRRSLAMHFRKHGTRKRLMKRTDPRFTLGGERANPAAPENPWAHVCHFEDHKPCPACVWENTERVKWCGMRIRALEAELETAKAAGPTPPEWKTLRARVKRLERRLDRIATGDFDGDVATFAAAELRGEDSG